MLVDVCREGGGPLPHLASHLHQAGALPSRWTLLSASPTCNPLGRTLTFISADKIRTALTRFAGEAKLEASTTKPQRNHNETTTKLEASTPPSSPLSPSPPSPSSPLPLRPRRLRRSLPTTGCSAQYNAQLPTVPTTAPLHAELDGRPSRRSSSVPTTAPLHAELDGRPSRRSSSAQAEVATMPRSSGA